ncbi:unnamed protein product [Ciceribacter sp. T2.26MG-112.2]|nr:unnamed protein product [Ciceribacter naphthalenivorans]
MKPLRHRFFAKYSAQAKSSAKSEVNFSSDGGRSSAQRVGNRLSLILPV